MDVAKAFKRRELAEIDTGLLELGKHARGIELSAAFDGRGSFSHLDALTGRLFFTLELGQVAVNAGQLALDGRQARFDRVQTLLGVFDPLFADLGVVLQLAEFRHALTPNRSFALFQGALDPFVFGHRVDALGVDLFGARIEIGFLFAKLGGQLRTFGFEA